MNELEEKLKKVERLKFELEKIKEDILIFNGLYDKINSSDMDINLKDGFGTIYYGINAVYNQNKIIIEQNNEIIKYLQENKK